MPDRNGTAPFYIVPVWVLHLGLSPRAMQLYNALASFVDNKTRLAYPKRETLADLCGCTIKTVDRMTNELVEAGAIATLARAGKPNVYWLPRSPQPAQLDIFGGDTTVAPGATWAPHELDLLN